MTQATGSSPRFERFRKKAPIWSPPSSVSRASKIPIGASANRFQSMQKAYGLRRQPASVAARRADG